MGSSHSDANFIYFTAKGIYYGNYIFFTTVETVSWYDTKINSPS